MVLHVSWESPYAASWYGSGVDMFNYPSLRLPNTIPTPLTVPLFQRKDSPGKIKRADQPKQEGSRYMENPNVQIVFRNPHFKWSYSHLNQIKQNST
uniref:Uncharacterized protein n=1 Tax=Heterorhabditis bacteriophora TaxID=37862 RepID=A0A1I7WVD3_HETBA